MVKLYYVHYREEFFLFVELYFDSILFLYMCLWIKYKFIFIQILGRLSEHLSGVVVWFREGSVGEGRIVWSRVWQSGSEWGNMGQGVEG